MQEAEPLLVPLCYFWSAVADRAAQFSFPNFPESVRRYFEHFNDRPPPDDRAILSL